MRQFYPAIVLVPVLALAACKQSSQDVSESIAKATEFRRSGDLARARIELQKAVRAAPNNPQANLLMANVEETDGNLNAAIPYYVRAAAPDANLLEAQLKLESILLDASRLSEATARINFTVGAFPTNPDAIAMRADAEERQGDTQKAEADANAVLRQEPYNARAISVLAKLKLRGKKGDEALSLVDRGLSRHSDDLRLLQVRAATLLTLDQPTKAVSALQSIIRVSPRNLSALRALADLEASQGRFEEAFANFKAAADADPSDQDLQLALMNFLAAQGRPDQVETLLQSLALSHPQNSTYVLAQSEFYEREGKVDEARHVLDSALLRFGDTDAALDVRLGRAELAISQADFKTALTELNAVLAARPQNERALLSKSALLLQNRRVNDAIETLLTVVKNNPVSSRGFQLLAAAYTLAGDNDRGVDAMRRAIAVTPGDANAEMRLADFLQNAGRSADSREVMSRLTLQYPQNILVWLKNAQLAVARKDNATAVLSLARLRGLPSGEGAATLLDAQLKVAKGDLAGALTVFRSMIDASRDVDPNIVLAYTQASAQAGQSAQAAQYLQGRVADLSPEPAKAAWSSLMALWTQLGQDGPARSAFNKVAAAAPNDPDVYIRYAKLLLEAQKPTVAKDIVDAGLKVAPGQWSLLLLKGSIAEQRGDFAAALNDYEAASQANPLSMDALNNYASILTDRKPQDTAALQQLLSRAEPLTASTDPLMVDTVAWLNYRLGHFDKARDLLQKINAAVSNNPQLRFHLGAVLIASGDKAEGLKLLDSVKGAQFPGADEIEKLSAI